MQILVPILLFILGFVLLIYGGDAFVDGAVAIAKKWHVPDLLIGATVVSIGTTLPEIMVSAGAAFEGHSEIAYGNAIGSIICNTALIAALTLTFAPGVIDKKSLKIPTAFFFTAAIFYSVISYTTGYYSRTVGITLLLMFVVYTCVQIKYALKESSKKQAYELIQSEDVSVEVENDAESYAKEDKIWVSVLKLVFGAAAIAVGARLLVDNGTIIAEKAGVPESVIALTFVALGTSLPELITAITSLKKGHGALSLGNVIGANFFNFATVSGIATTVRPFSVPSSKLICGLNASLAVDIPVMFAVTLIMILPALLKGKVYRWQGISLMVIYASYCVFQFAF